jgi:integrase
MTHKLFHLYKRPSKKTGKSIYYVQFFDQDGYRLSAKSTGQSSKAATENWAYEQIRKGKVNIKKDISFSEYAKDWWVWDKCEYIKRKLARGKSISPAYVDSMRTYLTNHILPYFGDKKLQKITPKMIEKWLMELREKPSRQGKCLSPTTINHSLLTLKIMLQEAVRFEYLPNNPADKIEQLSENPKEKSILNIHEIKNLFQDDNINKIWGGNLRHYTINLLSASTGMRLGEIQALKIGKVHPDFVSVHWRWNRKYGLGPPKRNSYRDVPIPSKTSFYLQEMINFSPFKEPEDFVFYGNNRHTPLTSDEIRKVLYKAFENIGITPEERKVRNISFHSWRYFYNSILRGRIHDAKLQRLTGHRTYMMTEHYTRFNIMDFQDVLKIQEEFFG